MVRARKMFLEGRVTFYERHIGRSWLSKQRGELTVEGQTLRLTAAKSISIYKPLIASIRQFFAWIQHAADKRFYDSRWHRRGYPCQNISNCLSVTAILG
jgi:hypothetical protein